MTIGNYPDKYLLFNSQLSKHLSIVLDIDGVGLFGIADTYTTVRYGDAGLVYGLPGLVYGGLRSLNQIKPFLMLEGLTIQQRIEPEVGKGNIGQLQVSLIDYGGQVSYILAPGNVVPEIMGVTCKLYVGYAQTSFPTDYVLVYQGQITQVVCPPGKVTLQISDSSTKSRQPLFNIASTEVLSPIAATGTTISINNTSVLHQQILGPNGQYDPTVSTYLEIDSEIMQYAATGILNSTDVSVTRGVLGTTADVHSPGATVNGSVGFGQNPGGINCIDLALKLLLSGWDGTDITDVAIASFVYDLNGNFVSNQFVLKTETADFDLGLTVGDYFYVTGSTGGNNVNGIITGLSTGWNGQTINVQTNQTFTLENPTNAVVAFRSQYDTFPITCGIGCYTYEVDVSTFQAIRTTFFSSGATSNLRGYYNAAVDGQDTLANDIMQPLGCYSISRYGRISMAITKPPLPGNGTKLVQLDYTNITDPDKIQVTRATNQRSFYNEISYEFDYDVANQTFNSIQYFLDTTSNTNFGYTVVLPVQAQLVSTALGGALIAQERGSALLSRFKNCLIWIELTVNWAVGSLLEVSDIVVLKDNGTLKIMNFETGLRDLGVSLFEVIDRNYQIVTGNVKLKLLGGLGFDVSSRFGLVSPSTILGPGTTSTSLRLTPSFGQTTLTAELSKWTPLIGLPIMVHDNLWSVTGSSVIQGINPADSTALLISPALGFTPPAGYILDIAPYPTDTNPLTDQMLKKLYCHETPTIDVTAGASSTQFMVAASGAPLLTVGNWVTVRSPDYSVQSGQCFIAGVTGTTVVLKTALTSGGTPFTPSAGYFCEGVGYHDGTGATFMTDLAPSTVPVQQESIQFNNPVSEASLAAIGAIPNYLLMILPPVGTIWASL